jgi:hypothetical protein
MIKTVKPIGATSHQPKKSLLVEMSNLMKQILIPKRQKLLKLLIDLAFYNNPFQD